MKKYFSIFLVIVMVVLMMPQGMISIKAASTKTLSELKQMFPDGAYWNHVAKAGHGYNGYNHITNSECGDYQFSYSWTPCYSHSANAPIGQYDCNTYRGGMQCNGFARLLSDLAYGSMWTEWSTVSNKSQVISSVKSGDVIHYYGAGADAEYGHWVFVAKVSGSTVTVGECNAGGNCKIGWSRTINLNNTSSLTLYKAPYELEDSPESRIPNKVTLQNFRRTYTADEDITFTWDESDPKATHFTLIIDKMENGKYVFYTWNQYAESGVTKRLPVGLYNARIIAYNSNYWESDGSDWLHADYDYVDFEVTEPKYYFNVQGWLDGQASDNTDGYGTFDVYINGELVRDDTTDYYVKHPAGSTYEIRDIKPIGCHAYDGMHYGSISGAVPEYDFSISLSFITSHVWGECVSIGADEHKRVCSNNPSHIEISAHCWDTGSFLVVPTTTTPGVIQFSCTDCGETKMEIVPALGDRIKGDADGDGAITVADALSALRIAAKLMPETPEMITTCDTDGDGKITVADALAILRVAAKLVASL